MDKVLAIIDGDGLVYHSSKETLQGSIDILDEKIQNIFDKTKATHYIIFISNSPYFRHQISSDYKLSRTKYKSELKWLKTLKSYLIENWGAQSMKNVEADDLVSYWVNKNLWWGKFTNPHSDTIEVITDNIQYLKDKQLVQSIICSPDKDLLNSIPGKHFNYTYKPTEEAKQLKKDNPEYLIKEDEIIKGWWIETVGLAEAGDFKLMQLVVGDTTDNIKGIEGAGIKYWERMQETFQPCESIILNHYIDKYGVSQGIYEFQKNYRLLHLLENDQDFIREVGVLPEFPEIREVPNKVQPVNNDEMKF